LRWALCTARPMPPVSPCAPWLWSGISTLTGLARAATTRRGARRSTTSMASSLTPTGSTTSSSPPPWEDENYEPRNPMESGKYGTTRHRKDGFGILSPKKRPTAKHRFGRPSIDSPLTPLKFLGRGMEHALGRSFNLRLELPHPERVSEAVRTQVKHDVFDLVEAALLSGVLDIGEEAVLFPQIPLDRDRQFQDRLTEWRGSGAKMSAAELRRKVCAITL